MMRVAILITILNLDDRSPGCLEECQKQIDAISAEGMYSFSIFLNNEGAEACEAVLEKARAEHYDLYLLMDYDLRLEEGAIASFLENSTFLRHRAIIAGTLALPDGTLLSGGRTRHGRLLEPDPTIPIPCHLYDLSLLLVPEYAFSKLEVPSWILRKGFFDYTFGTRAAKAGIARVIAPRVLAHADRKVEVPLWRDHDYSLADRAASLVKTMNREVIRVIHSFFR